MPLSVTLDGVDLEVWRQDPDGGFWKKQNKGGLVELSEKLN